MGIKWEDRYEQLGSLQEDQLLHIARNESAQHGFRITAVELLRERKSAKATHPDLAHLNALIDGSSVEPDPIPEAPHDSEIEPVEEPGPLKASITTETLYGLPQSDDADEQA